MNYKTAPLPLKIPVRGMWYRIKEVPRHEAHLLDCVGRCVDEEATIYILESMTLYQKWSTLYHEWSHAICDGYPKMDLRNDESATQHLADNLMPLIQYLANK